jgi:molybdopterin converting factor small subunit
MKVTAIFHGILSDWVGIPQAVVELPPGGTLADLARQIKMRHGTKMPDQLWNEERNLFHKAVWAMRGSEKLTDPAAMLKEGDEVKFYLMVAGG